jgi:hypothetical protein
LDTTFPSLIYEQIVNIFLRAPKIKGLLAQRWFGLGSPI